MLPVQVVTSWPKVACVAEVCATGAYPFLLLAAQTNMTAHRKSSLKQRSTSVA